MMKNQKSNIISYIPYHLEIWMANPVDDVRLGASEVIIDADNIVTHEHEAIHQMRSHKAGTL